MTCKKCEAKLAEDAGFCHKCGNKIPQSINQCSNCNTELQADAEFCHKCGSKTTQTEETKSVNKKDNQIDSKINNQIKRGYMLLEDEEWEKANVVFREVLGINKQCNNYLERVNAIQYENAQAFIGFYHANFKISFSKLDENIKGCINDHILYEITNKDDYMETVCFYNILYVVMLLSKKDKDDALYDTVDKIIDKTLTINPEYYPAYICELFLEYGAIRAEQVDALGKDGLLEYPLSESKNYQRIIQFCSSSEREYWEDLNEKTIKYLEQQKENNKASTEKTVDLPIIQRVVVSKEEYESIKKAAAEGSPDAMCQLGKLLLTGKVDDTNICRDYFKANEYIIFAALEGNEEAINILSQYGVDGVILTPPSISMMTYDFPNDIFLTAPIDMLKYIQLMHGFKYMANYIEKKFSDNYRKHITSFQKLINSIHLLYSDHIAIMLEWGIRVLMFFDIDTYDAPVILEMCEDLGLLQRVPNFEANIDYIENKAAQYNMGLAYAKATRTKWVGGAISPTITGAIVGSIKGSIAAGAMNIGSGILHGIGDGIVKAINKSEIKDLEEKVYKLESTKDEFCSAVYNACLDITNTIARIIMNECADIGLYSLVGDVSYNGEELSQIDGRALMSKINNNITIGNIDYAYALLVEKLRREPLNEDTVEMLCQLAEDNKSTEYISILKLYISDFGLSVEIDNDETDTNLISITQSTFPLYPNVTYYKEYPSVPDFGAVNNIPLFKVRDDIDPEKNTMAYMYSIKNIIQEELEQYIEKYINILETIGFIKVSNSEHLSYRRITDVAISVAFINTRESNNLFTILPNTYKTKQEIDELNTTEQLESKQDAPQESVENVDNVDEPKADTTSINDNNNDIKSDKGHQKSKTNDKSVDIEYPLIRDKKCDFSLYMVSTSSGSTMFGFYQDGTVIVRAVEDYAISEFNMFNFSDSKFMTGSYECERKSKKVNPYDICDNVQFNIIMSNEKWCYRGRIQQDGDLLLEQNISGKINKIKCKYVGAVLAGIIYTAEISNDDLQKAAKRIEWNKQGLCYRCGGAIGGIITKKCKSCGKPM